MRYLITILFLFTTLAHAADVRINAAGDAYIKSKGKSNRRLLNEGTSGYIAGPVKIVGGDASHKTSNGIHFDLHGGADYVIYESDTDVIRFGNDNFLEAGGVYHKTNGYFAIAEDSPVVPFEFVNATGPIMAIRGTTQGEASLYMGTHSNQAHLLNPAYGMVKLEATRDGAGKSSFSIKTKNVGAGDLSDFTDRIKIKTSGDIEVFKDLDVSGQFAPKYDTATQTFGSNTNIDFTVGNTIKITSTSGQVDMNVAGTGQKVGQIVTLLGISDVNFIKMLDGSANWKLAGHMELRAADSLTCVWTGAEWIEISRSDN